MIIALIGSTGRVGSSLPALFRANGWGVRLLKRTSTGDEPGLETMYGDATVGFEADEDTLPRRLGCLLFRFVFPAMMDDKQAEAEVLKNSDLDWTMLRLPLVVSGPVRNEPVAAPHRLDGWTVRLDQVGPAIVRLLRTGEHRGEAPFLFNP